MTFLPPAGQLPELFMEKGEDIVPSVVNGLARNIRLFTMNMDIKKISSNQIKES